uniref:Serine-threonine/tyrosine-protein kinase catalytic domain-containing protein n=2 Tax=Aegilops tauschii TaxID=37682 RepID=M8CIT5_AEGTA
MDSLLDPSSRDESELKEIKRCMDIGLQCTAKERTERPTMSDVIDLLDGKELLRKPPTGNEASSFKKKGKA